jgi:hypothetical protein
MRGCIAGLVQSWSFYIWPDEEGERHPPEDGDIAIVRATGSCYLVLDIKPSARKGKGWYRVKVEGLGIGAAEIGEEGTFPMGRLSHEDLKAIAAIEACERVDRGELVAA